MKNKSSRPAMHRISVAAILFLTFILPILVLLTEGELLYAQTPSGPLAENQAAPLLLPSKAPAVVSALPEMSRASEVLRLSSTIGLYLDPVQGTSSSDLIRRALASNGELAATRLDIERARARLLQSGLRPNPTLDFEQTTERLTGSGDDRITIVGVALPVELGGKRARRINLAQAELEAAESQVADRERRLVGETRALYAEVLSALSELQLTEEISDLNVQTTRVVEVRVGEGDTAPIELNLLRVEVDRMRSRRALVEGRLQAAILRLKSIAGIPATEPLRVREDLTAPVMPVPPPSLETAVEIALRTRPDLRLARLGEAAAEAGLQLARAQGTPDATLFTRYTSDRTTTDLPIPLVPVPNYSRRLTFGVSIGLPLFNKNQGAKAEAAVAITQAQKRREFAEAVVRTEVAGAYARYEAAQSALQTFDQGVIARSNENIKIIRAAYQLGAFRVTDLLNEQRRLLDSQRELIEALGERYRALSDIQSAIGTRE